MNILSLEKTDNNDIKISQAVEQFNQLLLLIKEKNIPVSIIEQINKEVAELNSSLLTSNEFLYLIKKKQNAILKLLEKELKIVPKNHYRNLWMILGMTIFGLPIGTAIGISLGNISLLGAGLPIGMGIGIGIGSKFDKKALQEGRQLDIKLK